MFRQLQKLAIICNLCFLATLLFQLWEGSRKLPEQLLNTIVILGVCALLVNIITLAMAVYLYRKKAVDLVQPVWMNWVMAIFAILQIVWLGASF